MIACEYKYYLGPHSPLSLQLQRLLASSSDRSTEVDSEYPTAKMHREVLAEFLKLPESQLADENTHQMYVDTVLEHDRTRRVIYNFDAFLGSRKNSLEYEKAYPSLERKAFPLLHLTSAQNVTIFMCLQNYVQFVDKELEGHRELRERLHFDPFNLTFSGVPFVSRLQEAWPEVNILIFDSQDLAPKWAAIVAMISGHPLAHFFENITDFPSTFMNKKGRIAYRRHMAEAPSQSLTGSKQLPSSVRITVPEVMLLLTAGKRLGRRINKLILDKYLNKTRRRCGSYRMFLSPTNSW